MNWKFFARMAATYLRAAGEQYIAKDENDTGKDDVTGQSLVYAANLIDALVTDKAIPKAPYALR